MSDFDDEFAETASPEFFARMGDAVTYVDGDGTETNVVAVLGAEMARDVPTRDGFDRMRWRTITVRRDPDGEFGGIAQPSSVGSFVIDGEQWSIDNVAAKTPYDVTLEVFRSATAEVGMKNHGRGRK
jgi:hypothetical protein